MNTGTSTFVIKCINFITMMLAIGVICFGVRMSTHDDACWRSLTLSVLGFGGLILVVFIITNNGSGHAIAGLRYHNFIFTLFGFCFLQLNSTRNWRDLKGCLVKSEDCNNLPIKYKTLKEYKLPELSPIEAGCCRPPSECGYPPVNASYFDLSYHPVSTNRDCKVYKNSGTIKCYDCDSCKAGVAQYMKTERRVVAMFNLILFVILATIYFVGCCARRNASRCSSLKIGGG